MMALADRQPIIVADAVRLLKQWGFNADAVTALEAIAGRYDLKPALTGEIDPDIPVDQRQLPQATKP